MKLLSTRRRLYSKEIEINDAGTHTGFGKNRNEYIDLNYLDEEGQFQSVKIQIETLDEARNMLALLTNTVTDWEDDIQIENQLQNRE